ncbi:MAG: hydroxyacid dehydrogenase [Bacteroidales bacterium]|nr:hydroxyacid dehydrogenase [Bacteroidales bacterium]
MKIVCVESLGLPEIFLIAQQRHYASMGHEFTYYMDRREDEATLIERMHDAEVVVISNIKLPASVLSHCPILKYLSVGFTGLDHIDLEYCKAHNITVQNAAGYSTTAVSELAVGMMLDLLRGVTTMDGVIRQGKGRGTFLGRELRGKTVGVVGTGAIGTATIRLLLAFGANVIAYSRTHRPEVAALGVEYMPLDDLLRQSDIVTLHTPLTAETRGLIGERELALMQDTALLINTARGPVCDIAAVAAALREGRIAGAAFDVFEQEPPLPLDHPLLSVPNCLLTPHVAFATVESFVARGDIVFGHIDDWLNQQ